MIIQIAAFIILITLAFYLSEKIMWLIYFLFNFRLWQIILEKLQINFILEMNAGAKLIILTMLAMCTYFMVYLLIMRIGFTPVKYIILSILMIIVFKHYTLSEIFFFKDYWNFNLMDSVGVVNEGGESAFSKNKFVDFWTGVLNAIVNTFLSVLNWAMNVLNMFW